MIELPVLFQTDMVQSILAGRKDMTRRTVKGTALSWLADFTPEFVASPENNLCPYGKAGDVLWVRESFLMLDKDHVIDRKYVYKANMDKCSEEIRQEYIKAGRKYKWKPSIHMPKEAARIWQGVVSVKIERAQDISEEDALREGIMQCTKDGNLYKYGLESWKWQDWHKTAKEAFKHLWISINGQESWDANPWVWVIEYEVLSTTGKPANLCE